MLETLIPATFNDRDPPSELVSESVHQYQNIARGYTEPRLLNLETLLCENIYLQSKNRLTMYEFFMSILYTFTYKHNKSIKKLDLKYIKLINAGKNMQLLQKKLFSTPFDLVFDICHSTLK